MPLGSVLYKRILFIDLNQKTSFFKNDQSLYPYIGGVGVGQRLLLDINQQAPIVIATGPLVGLFPFASKCYMSYVSGKSFYEKYGGGRLGALLNLAGIDAIVFTGNLESDLHIKISDNEIVFSEISNNFDDSAYDFYINDNKASSENYFSFGEISTPPNILASGHMLAINIINTFSFKPQNYYDYEETYNDILEQFKKVTVEAGNSPSCFGCPLGCDMSKEGEDNLNISLLPRCLVSCGYAQNIYKDIPTVFSCLNSIGYLYRHEHLESLTGLIRTTSVELNNIFE